ncbi:MAG TPA: hypothetical protein VKU00_20085 [Chthonomonadaceae bacterium]|nr:hypothetical protein [Chthonomonadaceae bacterium]
MHRPSSRRGFQTLASLLLFPTLWLSANQPARADILYHQPSNFSGGTVYASQNDSGGFGNYATVYDDFTLSHSSALTDVSWQGGFFNPSTAGTITGFTLTFSADKNGLPGRTLRTEFISGNANQTSVGTEGTVPIYDYSAILPSVFNAAGDKTYWLSIVPDLTLPSQWGWQTGTGGDGQAVQDLLGSRSRLSSDMAFTLSGSPRAPAVPEGDSWEMLTAGMAALLLGSCWRIRR